MSDAEEGIMPVESDNPVQSPVAQSWSAFSRQGRSFDFDLADRAAPQREFEEYCRAFGARMRQGVPRHHVPGMPSRRPRQCVAPGHRRDRAESAAAAAVGAAGADLVDAVQRGGDEIGHAADRGRSPGLGGRGHGSGDEGERAGGVTQRV